MPETGEMVWPKNNSKLRPEIDMALARHWEDAQAQAKDQGAKRKRMGRLVYRLGIPAGTLAAVAGSTAVAAVPSWITAGIALLSALLSAAMGIIAPVEGRIDHGRKEADFAYFARVVWSTRLVSTTNLHLRSSSRLSRGSTSSDISSIFERRFVPVVRP
jgi:hypothetical protein